MSVYSGFATRQQQKKYNSLLETLLITLSKRIIKFYHHKNSNQQKFKLLIRKLFKKMLILQQGKYYAPKYTNSIIQLLSQLNIEIDSNQLNGVSTNLGESFLIGIQQNQKLKRKISLQTSFLRSKSLLQNKQVQLSHSQNPEQKVNYHTNFFDINSKTKLIKKYSKQEKLQSINQIFDVQKQKLKAATRLKLKYLKDMKQLRDTTPQLDNYLPKPIDYRRSLRDSRTINLCPILQQISNRDYRKFRRPKYSNVSMEIQ